MCGSNEWKESTAALYVLCGVRICVVVGFEVFYCHAVDGANQVDHAISDFLSLEVHIVGGFEVVRAILIDKCIFTVKNWFEQIIH